jgi:hypothetical protein
MRIDKAGRRDPSQSQRRFVPKLMMLGALGIVAASALLVPEMALSASPLGGPGTPMSPVPALKPSIPQAPVPSNAPIAPVINTPHVLGGGSGTAPGGSDNGGGGTSGTPTKPQGTSGVVLYTGTIVREGDQFFITDRTTNVKYTLTGKALGLDKKVGKRVQVITLPEGQPEDSCLCGESVPPPHGHPVILHDVD